MGRLGDTIHSARIAVGFTEKQLGKKCGLAEVVIKDIESGRRIASDDQAQRILKILGIEDPVSTELEVAAEPQKEVRQSETYSEPQGYTRTQPVKKEKKLKKSQEAKQAEAPKEEEPVVADAWRDALGGTVKRVPVLGIDQKVLDYILTPIVDGKIEGGVPEKVFYYRCPDDALRGFRIYAGDMLLTVPTNVLPDEQMLALQYKGELIVRKVTKQDGGRVLLQSFDREFTTTRVDRKDILVVGRCVRLVRTL